MAASWHFRAQHAARGPSLSPSRLLGVPGETKHAPLVVACQQLKCLLLHSRRRVDHCKWKQTEGGGSGVCTHPGTGVPPSCCCPLPAGAAYPRSMQVLRSPAQAGCALQQRHHRRRGAAPRRVARRPAVQTAALFGLDRLFGGRGKEQPHAAAKAPPASQAGRSVDPRLVAAAFAVALAIVQGQFYLHMNEGMQEQLQRLSEIQADQDLFVLEVQRYNELLDKSLAMYK